MRAARRQADAVGWLRELFPDRPLPPEATDDDLRDALASGRLLCALLRRLCPGALLDDSSTDNVGRFRAAIRRMGVPTFSAYDLERVAFLYLGIRTASISPSSLPLIVNGSTICPSRGKCQPS